MFLCPPPPPHYVYVACALSLLFSLSLLIFPFPDNHPGQKSSLHRCCFVPKICRPNLIGWLGANHYPPFPLKFLLSGNRQTDSLASVVSFSASLLLLEQSVSVVSSSLGSYLFSNVDLEELESCKIISHKQSLKSNLENTAPHNPPWRFGVRFHLEASRVLQFTFCLARPFSYSASKEFSFMSCC